MAGWEKAEAGTDAPRDGQRGLLPRGILTRTSFNWALGILLSRCFSLPGKVWEIFNNAASNIFQLDTDFVPALFHNHRAQGNIQALIPWADFLNHNTAASTAHVDWDAASSSVVLLIDRDYKKGEQICERLLLKGCARKFPLLHASSSSYSLQMFPTALNHRESSCYHTAFAPRQTQTKTRYFSLLK